MPIEICAPTAAVYLEREADSRPPPTLPYVMRRGRGYTITPDFASARHGFVHTDAAECYGARAILRAVSGGAEFVRSPRRAINDVTVNSRASHIRDAHLTRGAALQGAGKRAAFALFYAPLHFLLVRAIVRTLDPTPRPLDRIVDLGCGTGAAGAAWGVAWEEQPRHARPRVWGIDLHPWAAAEAAWTYRTLGLQGHARRGDLGGARLCQERGKARAGPG